MKKGLVIPILILIMIFSLVVPVFAALPTYVVTGQMDKIYGVGKTKEVTFTFSVKDFVGFPYSGGKDGINTFKAVLDFNDAVFEPIEINLTQEGNYNGIKTVTSTGAKAIESLNNWAGLTYNPENKRLVIEAPNFVKTEQDILRITLKVKANAPTGNTTVTLKEILASDQVRDLPPSNGTVSLTVDVIDSIGEATDPDYANGFGGYIRILPETKVSEFKVAKINFTQFKNEQGTTLAETDFIPTGTSATDGTYSYTLIAVGDVNSDGKATVTDLSQIKAFEVGLLTTLTANQKRAADIKWDAKYSVVDRSQLRILLVRLGDPKITIWYGTGNATCVPVEKN